MWTVLLYVVRSWYKEEREVVEMISSFISDWEEPASQPDSTFVPPTEEKEPQVETRKKIKKKEDWEVVD